MINAEVFSLADISRSFATRARGKEVAGLVADFAAATMTETIIVAWDGVTAASPSFIDEFVDGLHRAIQSDPLSRPISFTADESGVIDLVDVILRRRESPIRIAARQQT